MNGKWSNHIILFRWGNKLSNAVALLFGLRTRMKMFVEIVLQGLKLVALRIQLQKFCVVWDLNNLNARDKNPEAACVILLILLLLVELL